MEINREIHYCKHCRLDFIVELDPEQTGDFFLVCPTIGCGWKHYRSFHAGVALHCDLNRRKVEPRDILGKR